MAEMKERLEGKVIIYYSLEPMTAPFHQQQR
jgi:hypothetical protein